MKKLMIILSAGFIISSCSKDLIRGNGPVITETRSVSNFNEVSVSGSTDVFITQGAAFSVEIKGYSNLLPHFETRLVNNTLYLGYENGTNVQNDNTEVFITMPSISGLSTAGTGNITTTGIFDHVSSFNARVAGSGSIYFSEGSAQQFSSVIEGSGNILAFGMQAVEAETRTTGSGNTEITATSKLKVKITGSGNVYYKSTPLITADISGSGVVQPR